MPKSFLYSCILFAVIIARADINGADPRLTGAPGDQTCVACHGGTSLNAGGGSVSIALPGAGTYTPGVTQRVRVEVADPTARRWGFQLSARLDSNPSNGQAGSFANTGTFTKVTCENGRQAPCTSSTVIQFATHTTSGTRSGTTGSVAFDVDWTPPATDLGSITFYAAGNATNGDGRNSGDHVYTGSVQLTPAAVVPKPSISTERGILNAANPTAGIAPGTWIVINGENLAATSRTWTAADIVEGKLPAALDNVSATVNGKAANVEAVSPTKLNVLTPDDDAVGAVEVRVKFQDQQSEAAFINLQPQAPALFTVDGKSLALSAGENAMFDKSDRFFATDTAPATVKPGDQVTLYGTGFGANLGTPEQPAVTATIGGVAATVVSVQLVHGMPRVYGLVLQAPEGMADGVFPVVVTVNGVSSPDQTDSNLLTVAQPTP